MPQKNTMRNLTGAGSPEEPNLDSLVTALEGLEAGFCMSKKDISSSPPPPLQDRNLEHNTDSGSGPAVRSGYLLTPALDSSTATPRTPSSTSVRTPLPSEVECHSDHQQDVQWYHLTQIKDRGIGLVAARRIPAGTLIMSEPTLIKIPLWVEANDSSAIETAVKTLSKAERKQYLQLFNAKKGGDDMSQVSGIYNSNCYDIRAFDDQGGSCIGLMSSRVNHSCLPNVAFSYVPADQVSMAMITGLSPTDKANTLRRGMMQFRAIKNISKGKELLSNYEKNIFVGRKSRVERLRRYYGFECSCEACVPTSDFWQKSDARRKAMEECVRAGAAYEREWTLVSTSTSTSTSTGTSTGTRTGGKDLPEGNVQSLAENAIAKLHKLEGLLIKEGLTYTPLANCYKSLAKWSTRMGARDADLDAISWLQKEQEVVTRCFGKDSLRARTLAQSLSLLVHQRTDRPTGN